MFSFTVPPFLNFIFPVIRFPVLQFYNSQYEFPSSINMFLNATGEFGKLQKYKTTTLQNYKQITTKLQNYKLAKL